MRLKALKVALILASLTSVIILSPSLFSVLHSMSSESYSELYILGPNHAAKTFPFNIRNNEAYRIFLGIGNHIGSAAQYAVFVKLRNQSESSPDQKTSNPSPIPALNSYYISLPNGEYWETSIDFHFGGLNFSGNNYVVEYIVMNDVVININKTFSWDSERKGFYLQLFFELWIRDPESNEFLFHNRSVGIWLNITAS